MSNEYNNIKEFIDEVNALEDWQTSKGLKSYLNVLGKIKKIYRGYKITNGTFDGLKGDLEGKFNDCVFEAISTICQTKFPSVDEIFENHKIKNEYKNLAHVDLLPLATFPHGINILSERTEISKITGIGGKYTNKSNVVNLQKSAKKFLDLHKRLTQSNDNTETL